MSQCSYEIPIPGGGGVAYCTLDAGHSSGHFFDALVRPEVQETTSLEQRVSALERKLLVLEERLFASFLARRP